MTLIFTSLINERECSWDRTVMPRSRPGRCCPSTRSSTCWFLAEHAAGATAGGRRWWVVPWSTCAIMAGRCGCLLLHAFLLLSIQAMPNRRGDDPCDGAAAGPLRRGRLSPEWCVFRLNSARFGRQGRRLPGDRVTIRRDDPPAEVRRLLVVQLLGEARFFPC